MIEEWYHGTNESSAINICESGIDFSKSNPRLDFGRGFYLTNDIERATIRAKNKSLEYSKRHNTNESAAIVKVQFEETPGIKKKVFSRFIYEDEWAKFVIANRLPIEFLIENGIEEHNLDNRYDIVIGGIADSDVYDFVDMVLNKEVEFNSIKASYILSDDGRDLGKQMSIHTIKGLACIKSIRYDII